MNQQACKNNGHGGFGMEKVLGTVCWAALMEDSGTPVLLLDGLGRIVQTNSQGAGLLGATVEAAVGRSYAEFCPAEFARERMEFIRMVAETGQSVVVEGMVNGSWHRTSMRRLTTDGTPLVLMVFTAVARGEKRPGPGAVRGQIDDLGPLRVLTTREMEILRLIGNGLSTAEIAKELHRSVKTIEWHRVSLGNKLKASNRVGLARIAIQAGLSGLGSEPAMSTPDAA